MMLDLLSVVGLSSRILATAIISTFFGGSIYINIVETPARISLKTCSAIVSHFQATFPRAMAFQGNLARTSFLLGLVGFFLDDDPHRWLYLVADACILLGVFAWTAVGIMPTNYALMGVAPGARDQLSNPTDAPKKKEDSWAVEMATKWDQVHAVRTVASGVAVLLWGVYWGNKIYNFL